MFILSAVCTQISRRVVSAVRTPCGKTRLSPAPEPISSQRSRLSAAQTARPKVTPSQPMAQRNNSQILTRSLLRPSSWSTLRSRHPVEAAKRLIHARKRPRSPWLSNLLKMRKKRLRRSFRTIQSEFSRSSRTTRTTQNVKGLKDRSALQALSAGNSPQIHFQ